MTFGMRLKEERKRLKLTQIQCAKLCGIVPNTQLLYEAGKRSPDACYLAAIAQAGADVQYLITGKVSEEGLSAEEQALVVLYRQAKPEARRVIFAAASGVGHGPSVTVGGNVGQLVSGDMIMHAPLAINQGETNHGTKRRKKS